MSDDHATAPVADGALRQRRAVVVADVVESVRLMQHAEADTIARWQQFVALARDHVLPRHHGRLVKSLGDGLLLVFDNVADAVAAALALQQAVQTLPPLRNGGAVTLRIGVHWTELVADALDIYGSGVNLAARVAGLAGRGEVVVTAEVRDELLAGVDAELVDMGHCWVKHVDAPLRVFRVGPRAAPGLGPAAAAAVTTRDDAPAPAPAAARPTLLVLAPDCSNGRDTEWAALLASRFIDCAAPCGVWNVVSRISTAALQGRPLPLPELAARTGADCIVTGHCHSQGDHVVWHADAVDAASGDSVWQAEITVDRGALLHGGSGAIAEACNALARRLIGVGVQRGRALALPSLQAWAILFRSVTMLHHTRTNAAADAEQGLLHLAERHPAEPEVHAWAARAAVLRVAQDARLDPRTQALRARDHLRRALDIEPQHGLARAVEGLVCLFIERDLDAAQTHYAAAMANSPNEPLGWLFMAAAHAHHEDGAAALACATRAQQLSPLGPMDHYYQGVKAWAHLAAGELDAAEALALSAMRHDCTHRPTYLTLLQTQALQGKLDAARGHAQRLLALSPGFSVARFLGSYPGGANAFAHRLADAMRAAGVPG